MFASLVRMSVRTALGARRNGARESAILAKCLAAARGNMGTSDKALSRAQPERERTFARPLVYK